MLLRSMHQMLSIETVLGTYTQTGRKSLRRRDGRRNDGDVPRPHAQCYSIWPELNLHMQPEREHKNY